MDSRIQLEKKLNNRMSLQDLISRGIIYETNKDGIISSNLSLLDNVQRESYINAGINQGRGKEDLTRLRIINKMQDDYTTALVREKLNDHLKTRPGPLEVFQYLVCPSNPNELYSYPTQCYQINVPQSNEVTQNSLHNTSTINPLGYVVLNTNNPQFAYPQYSEPTYSNRVLENSLALCQNEMLQTSHSAPFPNDSQRYTLNSGDGAHSKLCFTKKSKGLSHRKFTSYNFHEYKPKSTPNGNRFIKCTDHRNPKSDSFVMDAEHYKKLIEQQALFLQYEVAQVSNQNIDQTNSIRIQTSEDNFSRNRTLGNFVPNQNGFHVQPVNSNFTLTQNEPLDVDADFLALGSIPDFAPPSCDDFGVPASNLLLPSGDYGYFTDDCLSCMCSDIGGSSPSDVRMCNINNQINNQNGVNFSEPSFIASAVDDENIVSDVRSSDNLNSLYSDFSEFENRFGLGSITDVGEFPSISDKVALYEKLSSNVP